jgi:hypothetical protein
VYIDAQKSLNIFNDIYKRACSELKTGYHDDISSVGSSSTSKGGGGGGGGGRKKPADAVGPRGGMAMTQQHLSQVFRDPGADANPLATTMVEKYKEEMNKALTRLVEMEGENTVLKAKLASAQKRNAELEGEVGGLRRQQQQQQQQQHQQQQAVAPEAAAAAVAMAVPGVAPVTKEERERLLTYVQTIVDAGDENLSRQVRTSALPPSLPSSLPFLPPSRSR